MGLPSITGYVEVGGWLFEKKHLDLVGVALEPPPRRYGVLDHMRTDIRAGHPIIFWVGSIGAIVYGALATEWVSIALGVVAFLFMLNGARMAIGVGRHGVVRQATVDRIDKQNSIAAETFDVPVGDVRITVVASPPLVLESLLRVGPVDVLVLYDPRAAKPRGHVFAVRPRTDEAVDVAELRQRVASLSGPV